MCASVWHMHPNRRACALAQEYDVAGEGQSQQERLARQRKNLKAKLGLGGPVELMDTSDLVKDEDLMADAGPSKAAKAGKEAAALVSEMTGGYAHNKRLSQVQVLKPSAENERPHLA